MNPKIYSEQLRLILERNASPSDSVGNHFTLLNNAIARESATILLITAKSFLIHTNLKRRSIQNIGFKVNQTEIICALFFSFFFFHFRIHFLSKILLVLTPKSKILIPDDSKVLK